MDSEEENSSTGAECMAYRSHYQHLDDRRKIRSKYMELIEDARKEKENEELDATTIMQNMTDAEELFKDVCRPREAVYDAKLMNIHNEITKKHAHHIQDGSPFIPAIFLTKLANQLMKKHSISEVINLSEDAWMTLGNKVFQMFNRIPRLNFIQGTLVEPAESQQQQKPVKEKNRKQKAGEVCVVQASDRTVNPDKTFEQIQKIKTVLTTLYKKNKGKPICYFLFTVDPDSFSRTIENMFHVAVLIKEREVFLSMDNNGLPVIEPIFPNGTASNCETTQSILTMNVDKWKKLIEVFQIRKPLIPPPCRVKHSAK